MAWFRLTFRESVERDLQAIDKATAQRLFEKTKWLASNVGNLRHEAIDDEFPQLHKYAVGGWRIFYSIDRAEQVVDVHAIVPKQHLRT